MAGFEQSHEGLGNLILREQYFLTCTKALQTSVKEKGKLSLKDVAKAANNYYEAHCYPDDNCDHHRDKSDVYTTIAKQYQCMSVDQLTHLLQRRTATTVD